MLARLPTNLKEVPRALQLLDSDTLDSEQVQTETDGNESVSKIFFVCGLHTAHENRYETLLYMDF